MEFRLDSVEDDITDGRLLEVWLLRENIVMSESLNWWSRRGMVDSDWLEALMLVDRLFAVVGILE